MTQMPSGAVHAASSSTRLSKISSFWSLWTATALANLADGIFKLALPLAALQLTDSPSLIAGVVLAVRLPWLLFALFAGVLADRLDRRKMIVGANFARAGGLALMVAGMLLNMMSLPMIYVIALLLGIAETLADTASSSILPSVVKTDELEKANARLVGAITVSNEFIGPPLGGALAALSLALAFATSSAIYLVAAVAALLMVGSFKPVKTTRAPMLRELIDGLRYVWHNKLLRALAIMVAVMNFGWSAWLSVIVLYVVAPGPGGLSEFGYGVMLTSIGIGGLFGSVIAVPFVKRFGRRWAIGADIIGTIIILGVPALTSNPLLIGIAAVIGGIGGAMWGVVVSSIRQQMIPDAMQGRTSGVFRLFGYGALAVGAAAAGAVAEIAGIPAVFALCTALTALFVVPFFRVVTPEAIGRSTYSQPVDDS